VVIRRCPTVAPSGGSRWLGGGSGCSSVVVQGWLSGGSGWLDGSPMMVWWCLVGGPGVAWRWSRVARCWLGGSPVVVR